MSGETVYLLEATPLNASGVATTVCFSAGLYNEAELKAATGNAYPVRLSQAYTHETSIFEDNTPGQTNISLGSSTINNADGRFDFLLNYAWDARPITIKRGKQGAAYNTYTTEFVGSTTEITADGTNLVLTLRDNSYKLAKPLQLNKYLGSGGAEGGVDLQNKTKPLLFGKIRNASPVWVDQALLTAQIHDGVLVSIDNVYDRANLIKFQADFATYVALAAANIQPGYYGTCLAGGYIRLGAPPAGTLTVDAVAGFSSTSSLGNGLSRTTSMISAAKAGTSGGFVACVGDSTTAGVGCTSYAQTYPAILAQNLNSAGIPAALAGFAGHTTWVPDSRLTFTGAPTTSSFTTLCPGVEFDTVGQALHFTEVYPIDIIDIFYIQGGISGTATVDVDGGSSLGTVSTNNATSRINKLRITVPRGSHTVNITLTSGQVFIQNVVAWDSTSKKIYVLNLGYPAKTSAQFNGTTGAPYDAISALTLIAPILTVYNMGINDWENAVALSTYNSNMQAFITGVTPFSDVLLVGPNHTGGAATDATQSSYDTQLGTLASTNNLTLKDIRNISSSWATYAAANAAGKMSDTLHPSASGYSDIGSYLATALTPTVTGSVPANIPALAQQLLTGRLGLNSSELDVTAFNQASTDAPWAFEGIYFQEPDVTQYDELLETLASAVNGFWYVTRAGLISFKIFKFGTSVATIRQEDIDSLGKAPSPAPLFRVKVNYGKNATVQPPSDFTIPKQLLNAYLDKMYHYVDTSVGSPNYSGAGVFHAFLNNTEINGLNIATFSVPNKESWISIDPQGNITVTAPPTSPASAILRVNLGEFAWDEVFTVVKDAAAPLNKIDLSLSTDRLYFDDAGQPSPAGQSVVATATGTNTTAPITITAVDNLGNNVAITGGNTVPIANVSNSVLVQWVEVKAVDANGIQQRKRFIVQHGNDAYAQSILGSYSAAVTFYFQGTAPTTGMQTNDVWVNTADANKTYRWTGSSWAQFSDTRIVDALTNAAGAQATADSKIKTYVSTTAPTGTFALGDLWYNPNTQALLRWNNTSWADTVSTVGAQIGSNLTNSGAVVSGPAILNSAVTMNPDGSISGAGGGQATLGGLGYVGLWAALGGGILLSGNKLTNISSGADSYTGGVVGHFTKGAQYVVTDVYQVNGKITVLSLDDDSTNFTLASQVWAVVFTYNTSTGHTVQLFNNNVSVAGPTNIGTGAVTSVWLKYNDTSIQVLTDATVRITYSTGVGSSSGFYPKALLFNIGAIYNNLTYGVSQVQPQIGANLTTSTGASTTDPALLNSAVSISSSGVLTGAGGGTVTLGGIAPGVDPNATRNRTAFQATDPGFTEDGALWGDTTNTQTMHRLRLGGVWRVVSNLGARGGTDLFDSSLAVQGDSAFKNSAVSISSGGVLNGAGGGTVTLGGIGFLGDVNATRNRTAFQATDPGFTEDGALWGDTTNTQTIHRLRLGGLWRVVSNVGARGGTDLFDSSLAVQGDSSFKNSAISISAAGVLNGAGGGTVTIGGLGGGPWATESRDPTTVYNPLPNVIYNSNFRLLNAAGWVLGWTQGSGWARNIGTDGSGAFLQINSGGTSICQSDPIRVAASTGYYLSAEMFAGGISAGSFALDVQWYTDIAGTTPTASGSDGPDMAATNGAGWTKYNLLYASPAGAVSCRIRVFISGATNTNCAVRKIKFVRGTVETVYSDDYTNSSSQLTISGTGIMVADGLQLPPIVSAGNRYYHNQTPTYTAASGTPATATITLPAGTLTVGNRTVSYNQLQAAVTGTGGTSATYYLYVNDPTYSGGTPSGNLQATTNALNTYPGTGFIFVGQISITFPSSGSSSGTGSGGGGGGLTACVWAESFVHTQRGWIKAYDVRKGDMLWVRNDTWSGGEWQVCEGVTWASEDCYYLFGLKSGVGVTLSKSTPIELRDGSLVRVEDANGLELPFEDAEHFWTESVIATPVGRKNVCKILAGQKCYSAGNIANSGIFTHNPKP